MSPEAFWAAAIEYNGVRSREFEFRTQVAFEYAAGLKEQEKR